jgi:hypothetical protein
MDLRQLKFLGALVAGGLVMGAQAVAQTTVTFEAPGNTTETKTIAGHNCTGQDFLDSVTLSYQARAFDAVIPGSSIRGLGAENTDPSSGGQISSCNTVLNLSIGVVGGPAGSSDATSDPETCLTFNAAPFDGTVDFNGASGQSLPNATNVLINNSVTYTAPSDIAFFTSAGFDARFSFTGEGSGSNQTAGAAFANQLEADGSLTVTYACKGQCPFDPSLPIDDPNCEEPPPPPCPYDPSLPIDDPACVPPPAVPGVSSVTMTVGLLGLPLIAGLLGGIRRRR